MPKAPQGRASHYIVDCFYPDVSGPGGFRKESFSLVASSDKEAIHEASYGIRGKPDHFQVRALGVGGNKIVFRSSNA